MGTDKLKNGYTKEYAENYDKVFGDVRPFDKWYRKEYLPRYDASGGRLYDKTILEEGWNRQDLKYNVKQSLIILGSLMIAWKKQSPLC